MESSGVEALRRLSFQTDTAMRLHHSCQHARRKSRLAPFNSQLHWQNGTCEALQYNYNMRMKKLHFEWDERKATANVKKHGISFEEAKTAFYDEQAKLINDPDHSEDEDRFVLLGLSASLKLLVVCHCYREGDAIRISSARKATAMETKSYP